MLVLLTLKEHSQTKVHCGRGQVHLTTFSTIFSYCHTLTSFLDIPSPFSLSWWRLSLSWLYPGLQPWVLPGHTEILMVNKAGTLLSDQVPEAPPFISYLVCLLQVPLGFVLGLKSSAKICLTLMFPLTFSIRWPPTLLLSYKILFAHVLESQVWQSHRFSCALNKFGPTIWGIIFGSKSSLIIIDCKCFRVKLG